MHLKTNLNCNIENLNIVVHTFSNNGLQTWLNIKKFLPEPAGYVFDSGPSKGEWDSPGKIFRANFPKANPLQKLSVSLIANTLYGTRHILKPFKNDFLYPEYIIKIYPKMVNR